MIEKFYALLERFVIAHELIAANSRNEKDEFDAARETVKKHEEKTTTKKRGSKTEAPAKATRGKKGTDKRAAIGEMAKVAVEGDGLDDDDADALVDKFDDLLEDFEVKNVKELDDDQVDEFHDALKEIIEEFYDAE